ncbi:universal stress protein UspA and related nucleotide-binding proteins [Candidatus Scalindua japonica]|uniref:Universal stress protein n=1 Tax=Candidatus Scalindua japonica TaxID=1284222 RepID=A0A286TXS0_9BACT|nr:universal stress protein [Candidatus Scalindua japonica]GAX60699.1 universal stress protein UspA and related nucleotide-binding proteins [Candidatus Scalindua japonica]
MIKLERILFPTDFSSTAEHALKYALTFASEHKAKLFVMHVIPNPDSPVVFGEDGESVTPPSFERMEAKAKKSMEQLIPERYAKELEIENIIVQGGPLKEILKCVKKFNIDLLTMASHGRKGISHMLMGSLAEKVVQMAPCPVLTIKHPEHEFVLP